MRDVVALTEEDVKEWLKRRTEKFVLKDEQGQAIVIIAFSVIALILFAGLALDAATIYAGQSKLKRAVDAAALAGVVELPNEGAAEERTRQFMRANGFDTTDTEALPVFQFARLPASGYLQWIVTATYRIPLNFLPLINFDYAPVTEVAVAEFRSYVDIFTTQTGGRGIVGGFNMSNWGRYANPRWGDAFTPQCWTCEGDCPHEGGSDPSCPYSGVNPDHSELYNDFGNGYPFRIHIPPGYAEDIVQIELLDPDGYNQPLGSTVVISHTGGTPEEVTTDCDPYAAGDQNDQRDACYVSTGDMGNPYWLLRMDENRSFSDDSGGHPPSYTPAYNTETEYRLFYYRELPDQSVAREDIGTYVGGANDASTDMRWVLVWTLDVNCGDGSCDIPDAVMSDDGSRSLRLEVDGVSGSSENGFDLWAGPPPTDTVPSEVNARNLYLLDNPDSHDPGGIVTYGSGYLPLNVNSSGPITITFTFVPFEAIGIGMNVFHFDNDAGGSGQNIDYYLEGIPAWEWHQVGTLSLNGTWSTSQDFVYQPPGNRDHDNFVIPEDFYGGYLWGNFQGRFLDTSSWRIEYEGVVGDMFVRLIQ